MSVVVVGLALVVDLADHSDLISVTPDQKQKRAWIESLHGRFELGRVALGCVTHLGLHKYN